MNAGKVQLQNENEEAKLEYSKFLSSDINTTGDIEKENTQCMVKCSSSKKICKIKIKNR